MIFNVLLITEPSILWIDWQNHVIAEFFRLSLSRPKRFFLLSAFIRIDLGHLQWRARAIRMMSYFERRVGSSRCFGLSTSELLQDQNNSPSSNSSRKFQKRKNLSWSECWIPNTSTLIRFLPIKLSVAIVWIEPKTNMVHRLNSF